MTRHFIVVGAQRSGTTYLHHLLEEHPEIAMAQPVRPEPKAFLSDEVFDADAYRARWFGHADDATVLGEKSTSYLESDVAPGRIRAVLGEPQIMVQLRDPIARAISNWGFSRDHGLETRGLAEALSANLEGPLAWDPERTSVSPFAYLERGRYVDDLARWTDFPLRVQFFEELVADDREIAATYAWLGVDAAYRPEVAGTPVNQGTPVGETLGDDLVGRLRAWFEESDAALSEMLGRPLPWRPAP